MGPRRTIATGLALATVLMAAGTWWSGAAGATSGTLSIDAATMAFRHDSTHYEDWCLPNGLSAETENFGTVNGTGAYFGAVNLAQGSTIASLRLVVRDNDGDLNAHAYLLRKRLSPKAGYDSIAEGYRVLGEAHSNGASAAIRRFTDSSILTPVINTNDYAYYIEVVNCGDTVDPLGVQVRWTRP